MDDLYIPRALSANDKIYTEQELLSCSSVFIVLAEPGAGKTELLKKLSSLLGVTPVRASIFQHKQPPDGGPALVIDAVDEVARVDSGAVDEIVAQASKFGARKVVFSGRSSEWDESRTRYVKDCFLAEPTIVRLQPFNTAEQRRLFEAKFPGESFDRFVQEVQRVELTDLLGNPQFLQLFGEAFIEGGRIFTSKSKVFYDAIKRLAHESNKQVATKGRPPIERIINDGAEVFAKLLLSGASGVSTVEQLGDRNFPYLASLATDIQFLIDTRLFKPSNDGPEKHDPVHRIVAEYCAARYLASRVDDTTDHLSLARLISVIAPSGTARTELRGTIGWMAALSSEQTQLALVELDPYAVFANGDPSALSGKAKRRLLSRLDEMSRGDPYFRRSDVWRRFNVGRFFTADIKSEVAAILAPTFDNRSLRDLVIELISSSQASAQFVSELRALANNPNIERETRKASFSELIEVSPEDAITDITSLHLEDTLISFELSAKAIERLGAERVGRDQCVALLKKLAALPRRRSTDIGSRFFIRLLINDLDPTTVHYALGQLTRGLTCTCNPKRLYQCECRIGISKMTARLLDRYFESFVGPHHPAQIWEWTKALHFSGSRPDKSVGAAKILSEDHGLRRAVQWLAVANQTDGAAVHESVSNLMMGTTYAGTHLRRGDEEEIAAKAFDIRNIEAWTSVLRRHNIYDTTTKGNGLRTLQRFHAKQDTSLMRIWALRERQTRDLDDRRERGFSRRHRRYVRREAEIEAQNQTQFNRDRHAIAAGQFGGWTWYFARMFLYEPQNLTENADYGDVPNQTLRNCVPYILGQVPSLSDLATRKGWHIAQILLAHCIVRFRDGVALSELDPPILQAAWTEAGALPAFKDEEEQAAFNFQLESAVFVDISVAGRIVAEMIEPSLSSTEETPTHVHWLESKKVFHSFLETKPIDWLRQYPKMPLGAMESLFALAAKHGDRSALAELIDWHVGQPEATNKEATEEDNRAKRRRQFWVLNAVFFDTPQIERAWDELKKDRSSVLALQDRIGWFGGREETSLPPLSAKAIYRILDAFIGLWPRVHLPNSYGTGSPPEERAYRFLSDVTWRIENDTPANKLPVLDKLLSDERFGDFRDRFLTLRAEALRQVALQDFRAPEPADISGLLDRNQVASVEDLRALLVEELYELQKWLKGSETDPIVTFYDGDNRVDENTGRNRVVDRLNARMTALGLSVVIEHHMAGGNRCDFTATAMISGSKKLLVVEVKGQWHSELFSAASAQLYERYASHPDAAGQGIYLVLWFGGDETIAGKREPNIKAPDDLRQAIVETMPDELEAAIDVVVLDVSRPSIAAKRTSKVRGRRGKSAKS